MELEAPLGDEIWGNEGKNVGQLRCIGSSGKDQMLADHLEKMYLQFQLLEDFLLRDRQIRLFIQTHSETYFTMTENYAFIGKNPFHFARQLRTANTLGN